MRCRTRWLGASNVSELVVIVLFLVDERVDGGVTKAVVQRVSESSEL